MKNVKSDLIRKSVCLKLQGTFLLFTFIFSTVLWPLPTLAVEGNYQIQEQNLAVPDVSQIRIPEEVGIVEEIHQAKNAPASSPLVVYIQDAHCIYEAQANIRKIIDQMQKDHSLGLVALEGGDGKLDTELFRSFPIKDIKEKVIDAYVRRGELSGAEYAAIVNEKESDFMGIEDMKIYYEDKKAFLKAIENKKRIDTKLDDIERWLKKKKDEIYSAELKDLFAKTEDYEKENLSLLDYVVYLSSLSPLRGRGQGEGMSDSYPTFDSLLQAMEREKQIDFPKVEDEATALETQVEKALQAIEGPKKDIAQEDLKALHNHSTEFKQGSLKRENFYIWLLGKARELGLLNSAKEKNYPEFMSYLNHVQEMEKIKGDALFGEIDQLERVIKEKLFQNEDQRSLDTLFHRLKILRKLAKLELKREELSEYRDHRDDFAEKNFWDFIGRSLGRLELDPLFDPHLEFYQIAMKRDEILHKNLMKLLDEQKQKFAMIITGGFHSSGIKDMLKQDGVSYVVIIPRITQFDEKSPYWDVMEGKVSYAKYRREAALPPELATREHYNEVGQGVLNDEADAVRKDKSVKNPAEVLRWIDVRIAKLRTQAAPAGDVAKIFDALEKYVSQNQFKLSEIVGKFNDLKAAINLLDRNAALTPENVRGEVNRIFPGKLQQLQPAKPVKQAASLGVIDAVAIQDFRDFTGFGTDQFKAKQIIEDINRKGPSKFEAKNPAGFEQMRGELKILVSEVGRKIGKDQLTDLAKQVLAKAEKEVTPAEGTYRLSREELFNLDLQLPSRTQPLAPGMYQMSAAEVAKLNAPVPLRVRPKTQVPSLESVPTAAELPLNPEDIDRVYLGSSNKAESIRLDVKDGKLLVFVNDQITAAKEISKDELTPVIIGRSSKSDIQVPGATVSGRHLQIRFDGTQVFLKDLGSRNGTKYRPANQMPVPMAKFSVSELKANPDWPKWMSQISEVIDRIVQTPEGEGLKDLYERIKGNALVKALNQDTASLQTRLDEAEDEQERGFTITFTEPLELRLALALQKNPVIEEIKLAQTRGVPVSPVVQGSAAAQAGALVESNLGDRLVKAGLSQADIASLIIGGAESFRSNLGQISSYDVSSLSQGEIETFVREGSARMDALRTALSRFSAEDLKNFSLLLDDLEEKRGVNPLSKQQRSEITAILNQFDILPLELSLSNSTDRTAAGELLKEISARSLGEVVGRQTPKLPRMEMPAAMTPGMTPPTAASLGLATPLRFADPNISKLASEMNLTDSRMDQFVDALRAKNISGEDLKKFMAAPRSRGLGENGAKFDDIRAALDANQMSLVKERPVEDVQQLLARALEKLAPDPVARIRGLLRDKGKMQQMGIEPTVLDQTDIDERAIFDAYVSRYGEDEKKLMLAIALARNGGLGFRSLAAFLASDQKLEEMKITVGPGIFKVFSDIPMKDRGSILEILESVLEVLKPEVIPDYRNALDRLNRRTERATAHANFYQALSEITPKGLDLGNGYGIARRMENGVTEFFLVNLETGKGSKFFTSNGWRYDPNKLLILSQAKSENPLAVDLKNLSEDLVRLAPLKSGKIPIPSSGQIEIVDIVRTLLNGRVTNPMASGAIEYIIPELVNNWLEHDKSKGGQNSMLFQYQFGKDALQITLTEPGEEYRVKAKIEDFSKLTQDEFLERISEEQEKRTEEGVRPGGVGIPSIGQFLKNGQVQFLDEDYRDGTNIRVLAFPYAPPEQVESAASLGTIKRDRVDDVLTHLYFLERDFKNGTGSIQDLRTNASFILGTFSDATKARRGIDPFLTAYQSLGIENPIPVTKLRPVHETELRDFVEAVKRTLAAPENLGRRYLVDRRMADLLSATDLDTAIELYRKSANPDLMLRETMSKSREFFRQKAETDLKLLEALERKGLDVSAEAARLNAYYTKEIPPERKRDIDELATVRALKAKIAKVPVAVGAGAANAELQRGLRMVKFVAGSFVKTEDLDAMLAAQNPDPILKRDDLSKFRNILESRGREDTLRILEQVREARRVQEAQSLGAVPPQAEELGLDRKAYGALVTDLKSNNVTRDELLTYVRENLKGLRTGGKLNLQDPKSQTINQVVGKYLPKVIEEQGFGSRILSKIRADREEARQKEIRNLQDVLLDAVKYISREAPVTLETPAVVSRVLSPGQRLPSTPYPSGFKFTILSSESRTPTAEFALLKEGKDFKLVLTGFEDSAIKEFRDGDGTIPFGRDDLAFGRQFNTISRQQAEFSVEKGVFRFRNISERTFVRVDFNGTVGDLVKILSGDLTEKKFTAQDLTQFIQNGNQLTDPNKNQIIQNTIKDTGLGDKDAVFVSRVLELTRTAMAASLGQAELEARIADALKPQVGEKAFEDFMEVARLNGGNGYDQLISAISAQTGESEEYVRNKIANVSEPIPAEYIQIMINVIVRSAYRNRDLRKNYDLLEARDLIAQVQALADQGKVDPTLAKKILEKLKPLADRTGANLETLTNILMSKNEDGSPELKPGQAIVMLDHIYAISRLNKDDNSYVLGDLFIAAQKKALADSELKDKFKYDLDVSGKRGLIYGISESEVKNGNFRKDYLPKVKANMEASIRSIGTDNRIVDIVKKKRLLDDKKLNAPDNARVARASRERINKLIETEMKGETLKLKNGKVVPFADIAQLERTAESEEVAQQMANVIVAFLEDGLEQAKAEKMPQVDHLDPKYRYRGQVPMAVFYNMFDRRGPPRFNHFLGELEKVSNRIQSGFAAGLEPEPSDVKLLLKLLNELQAFVERHPRNHHFYSEKFFPVAVKDLIDGKLKDTQGNPTNYATYIKGDEHFTIVKDKAENLGFLFVDFDNYQSVDVAQREQGVLGVRDNTFWSLHEAIDQIVEDQLKTGRPIDPEKLRDQISKIAAQEKIVLNLNDPATQKYLADRGIQMDREAWKLPSDPAELEKLGLGVNEAGETVFQGIQGSVAGDFVAVPLSAFLVNVTVKYDDRRRATGNDGTVGFTSSFTSLPAMGSNLVAVYEGLKANMTDGTKAVDYLKGTGRKGDFVVVGTPEFKARRAAAAAKKAELAAFRKKANGLRRTNEDLRNFNFGKIKAEKWNVIVKILYDQLKGVYSANQNAAINEELVNIITDGTKITPKNAETGLGILRSELEGIVKVKGNGSAASLGIAGVPAVKTDLMAVGEKVAKLVQNDANFRQIWGEDADNPEAILHQTWSDFEIGEVARRMIIPREKVREAVAAYVPEADYRKFSDPILNKGIAMERVLGTQFTPQVMSDHIRFLKDLPYAKESPILTRLLNDKDIQSKYPRLKNPVAQRNMLREAMKVSLALELLRSLGTIIQSDPMLRNNLRNYLAGTSGISPTDLKVFEFFSDREIAVEDADAVVAQAVIELGLRGISSIMKMSPPVNASSLGKSDHEKMVTLLSNNINEAELKAFIDIHELPNNQLDAYLQQYKRDNPGATGIILAFEPLLAIARKRAGPKEGAVRIRTNPSDIDLETQKVLVREALSQAKFRRLTTETKVDNLTRDIFQDLVKSTLAKRKAEAYSDLTQQYVSLTSALKAIEKKGKIKEVQQFYENNKNKISTLTFSGTDLSKLPENNPLKQLVNLMIQSNLRPTLRPDENVRTLTLARELYGATNVSDRLFKGKEGFSQAIEEEIKRLDGEVFRLEKIRPENQDAAQLRKDIDRINQLSSQINTISPAEVIPEDLFKVNTNEKAISRVNDLFDSVVAEKASGIYQGDELRMQFYLAPIVSGPVMDSVMERLQKPVQEAPEQAAPQVAPQPAVPKVVLPKISPLENIYKGVVETTYNEKMVASLDMIKNADLNEKSKMNLLTKSEEDGQFLIDDSRRKADVQAIKDFYEKNASQIPMQAMKGSEVLKLPEDHPLRQLINLMVQSQLRPAIDPNENISLINLSKNVYLGDIIFSRNLLPRKRMAAAIDAELKRLDQERIEKLKPSKTLNDVDSLMEKRKDFQALDNAIRSIEPKDITPPDLLELNDSEEVRNKASVLSQQEILKKANTVFNGDQTKIKTALGNVVQPEVMNQFFASSLGQGEEGRNNAIDVAFFISGLSPPSGKKAENLDAAGFVNYLTNLNDAGRDQFFNDLTDRFDVSPDQLRGMARSLGEQKDYTPDDLAAKFRELKMPEALIPSGDQLANLTREINEILGVTRVAAGLVAPEAIPVFLRRGMESITIERNRFNQRYSELAATAPSADDFARWNAMAMDKMAAGFRNFMSDLETQDRLEKGQGAAGIFRDSISVSLDGSTFLMTEKNPQKIIEIIQQLGDKGKLTVNYGTQDKTEVKSMFGKLVATVKGVLAKALSQIKNTFYPNPKALTSNISRSADQAEVKGIGSVAYLDSSNLAPLIESRSKNKFALDTQALERFRIRETYIDVAVALARIRKDRPDIRSKLIEEAKSLGLEERSDGKGGFYLTVNLDALMNRIISQVKSARESEVKA